jgi:hypothetical protein
VAEHDNRYRRPRNVEAALVPQASDAGVPAGGTAEAEDAATSDRLRSVLSIVARVKPLNGRWGVQCWICLESDLNVASEADCWDWLARHWINGGDLWGWSAAYHTAEVTIVDLERERDEACARVAELESAHTRLVAEQQELIAQVIRERDQARAEIGRWHAITEAGEQPEPRVFRWPDTMPDDVHAVSDCYGNRWRRDDRVWRRDIGTPYDWPSLLAEIGPLTEVVSGVPSGGEDRG